MTFIVELYNPSNLYNNHVDPNTDKEHLLFITAHHFWNIDNKPWMQT